MSVTHRHEVPPPKWIQVFAPLFFCSISNGSMRRGSHAVAFPQGDGCCLGPRGNTVTFTYEKMDAVRLGGRGWGQHTVVFTSAQDIKNKNKKPFNNCGCRDWGADTWQEGHHCRGVVNLDLNQGSDLFPGQQRAQFCLLPA